MMFVRIVFIGKKRNAKDAKRAKKTKGMKMGTARRVPTLVGAMHPVITSGAIRESPLRESVGR